MTEPTHDETISASIEPKSIVLEARQQFSRSILWKQQRDFYDQRGTQAWVQKTVPDYPTTNPVIAGAYAKIVFAWLRDHEPLNHASSRSDVPGLDRSAPLYIIELGSGSGRFAFHFLKQFFALLDHSHLSDLQVTYVMTDIVQQNIQSWRVHPSLQSYIQAGRLDFAHFDAVQDEELRTVQSSAVISAQTVKNPIVVIANYVFDSIPQDVFRVQDHQLYQGLVSLYSSEADQAGFVRSWDKVQVSYEDERTESDYYADPEFNSVLKHYQQTLKDTVFTFPSGPMQCLRSCRRLSGDRLLFLVADKGYLYDDDLRDQAHPDLVWHGSSFSLMVNFHALAVYLRVVGGTTLTSVSVNNRLNIVAFLMGSTATDYAETRQVYQSVTETNNPYDFYTLQKAIWKHYDILDIEQRIAFLRLSGWDAEVFLDLFPVLLQQLDALANQRNVIYQIVDRVWEMYFYIGEGEDLPFSLGKLLCGLSDYAKAIYYLEQSIALYGPRVDTLFYLVMAHTKLQNVDQAREYLDQIEQLDPQFIPAKLLRAQIEHERN